MKSLLKSILALLIVGVVSTSCSSDKDNFDPSEQLEIEKAIIKEYVDKNYPKAKQYKDTGIWYEVLNEGEEANYEYEVKKQNGYNFIEQKATVDYTGTLLNGTVFDKTTDPAKGTDFPFGMNLNTGEVGGLLPVWVISFLPTKITFDDKEQEVGMIFGKGAQVGSHYRLIFPSFYGYGSQSTGKIPPNSSLEFEIKVLKMTALVAETPEK